MNKRHYLPKEWQFQFLLNSITRKKRISKWHKMEDFGVNLKVYWAAGKIFTQSLFEMVFVEQVSQAVPDGRKAGGTCGFLDLCIHSGHLWCQAF
jgi:hypothetical protein